jgi:uncharacterized protein (TIGR02145 family)
MKKKLTRKAFIFALAFICTNIVSAQDYMITFSGTGQSNEVETVEVKNTTQQTSVTLSGSDTLHLVDVVGISPIVQEKAGIFIVKATTETTVNQQRLITHSQSFGNPQISYLGSFDPSISAAQTKSTKNIVEMQYNAGERLVIKGISGDYSHTKSLIPNESQNIDFEFIECVDGDENLYGVVTIGEQVWMAENLKTTKYKNGEGIEYPGTNNSAWQYNTNGAYAWYNNDISWKDSYGALYNWHAVYNANGLCPTGWYVPSDAEWTQLVDYLVAQGFPNQWDNPNGAGNALKSCRQENSPLGGDCNTSEHPRWNAHSTHHGFDEFGFSAFPGGHRYPYGYFSSLGVYGYWWSSTEYSSTNAWLRYMRHDFGYVYRLILNKTNGFSVRCLRD